MSAKKAVKQAQPRITVVGSLNVDWIASVTRFPKAGETVLSSHLTQRFGGKGANQAIAATRQGVQVCMIGALGNDASGQAYRKHLQDEGIDDSGIITLNKALTGAAMIAVDERAENTIIVGAGANGQLKAAHIRQHQETFARSKAVLLQWESPMPVVLETLRIAAHCRVPVVMNPSPLHDDFAWGKFPVHTLIVNEGEARAIFGKRACNKPESLKVMLGKFALNRLIITRGANSTLGIMSEAVIEMPAFPVTAMDTVGAGDAFAGAYAACLAMRVDFTASVRYANAAGALATLKVGAQEAIPNSARVNRLLR